MADGRTSKRRVDDAEPSDAGARHKSAGELPDGRSGFEGYFDLGDEDAGVTFGAEVTAVLDGRCEVLLDYTGDREMIPTGLVRGGCSRHEGLGLRARRDGRGGAQPLGLLERRRKAPPRRCYRRADGRRRPARPPPPAPRRCSPAVHGTRRRAASGATAEQSTRAHSRSRPKNDLNPLPTAFSASAGRPPPASSGGRCSRRRSTGRRTRRRSA